MIFSILYECRITDNGIKTLIELFMILRPVNVLKKFRIYPKDLLG